MADKEVPSMSPYRIPSPSDKKDKTQASLAHRSPTLMESTYIKPIQQTQSDHHNVLHSNRARSTAYGNPWQTTSNPLGSIPSYPNHSHQSVQYQPPYSAPPSLPLSPYQTPMNSTGPPRPGRFNPSILEPTPRDHQPRVDPFAPSYGYGSVSSVTGSRTSITTPASHRSNSGGLDYQADDSTSRYDLTIRQQPMAARACGMGQRDRRVIDPPPIVQLSLRDFDPRSAADVDALRNPHNSLHCSLVDRFGSDITQTRDSHDPRRMSRGLTGSIMVSPFVGVDPAAPASKIEHARLGCFFIFPDLSCRQAGHYRLRFQLVQQRLEGLVPSGDSPILGVIESEIFEVFTAKDFPGMTPSTDLMMNLKSQGASVSVRRGNDGRASTKS